MKEKESFSLEEWIENEYITELEVKLPSNVPDEQKYIVNVLIEIKRMLNLFHQFYMDVQDVYINETYFGFNKIKGLVREVREKLRN